LDLNQAFSMAQTEMEYRVELFNKYWIKHPFGLSFVMKFDFHLWLLIWFNFVLITLFRASLIFK